MQITLKQTIDPGLGAEDIFQALLKSRGYPTSAQQKDFLHPDQPKLNSLLTEAQLKSSTLKSF